MVVRIWPVRLQCRAVVHAWGLAPEHISAAPGHLHDRGADVGEQDRGETQGIRTLPCYDIVLDSVVSKCFSSE